MNLIRLLIAGFSALVIMVVPVTAAAADFLDVSAPQCTGNKARSDVGRHDFGIIGVNAGGNFEKIRVYTIRLNALRNTLST